MLYLINLLFILLYRKDPTHLRGVFVFGECKTLLLDIYSTKGRRVKCGPLLFYTGNIVKLLIYEAAILYFAYVDEFKMGSIPSRFYFNVN